MGALANDEIIKECTGHWTGQGGAEWALRPQDRACSQTEILYSLNTAHLVIKPEMPSILLGNG